MSSLKATFTDSAVQSQEFGQAGVSPVSPSSPTKVFPGCFRFEVFPLLDSELPGPVPPPLRPLQLAREPLAGTFGAFVTLATVFSTI